MDTIEETPQEEKWVSCPRCNTGRCIPCKGDGSAHSGMGRFMCPSCNGTGHCLTCRGRGSIHRDYAERLRRRDEREWDIQRGNQ